MTKWAGWLVVLALAGAGVVRGAELRASKPEVRQAVVAVIEEQLTAFRAGDVRKAHGLASKELQRQKPTAVFARIVQASYPEVWASTRAEFGIVRDDGREAAVVVHVYSKAGDAAYAYALVKEGAAWRIHGVVRHAAKREKV
jgi:hypothetical protein